ncbi:MAG: thrombospondin type 3 repeat-containing protein [Myxococcota bacterium]
MTSGAENPVYGEGNDQGWLLAASSILSQVGVQREASGTGALESFLDDVRNALPGGGPPGADLLAELAAAQRALDPDLPRLGLAELQRIQGTNALLADVSPFLDTDGDGVRNDVDVCPFVADPDQLDSAGRGWGDACDTPITALSLGDGFGCAVLASDGRVTCWRDDAPVLGGVPPHPFAFPTSVEAPWGDGPGLDATGYGDVALAAGLACASTATGVQCFNGQDVWEVDLGDTRTDLAVMASRVCSLDDEGNATCLDEDGGGAIVMPVNAQTVAPFGANGVCTLDQDRALACFDATSGVALPDPIPAGPFRAIDGTVDDGTIYGCGISSIDGTVTCWGDAPPGVPTDSGFDGVATGVGLACAERNGGLPTCWRDPAICPEIPEDELRIPAEASALSVDACVLGAVGDDNLGYAWPRYWFRRPGAVP